MTGLTTHVLDLTQGKPADGLEISFFKIEQDNKNAIAKFVTNSDGRLDAPIFDRYSIRAGWYEMVFHAGKYLVVKHKMKEADLFFDNSVKEVKSKNSPVNLSNSCILHPGHYEFEVYN